VDWKISREDAKERIGTTTWKPMDCCPWGNPCRESAQNDASIRKGKSVSRRVAETQSFFVRIIAIMGKQEMEILPSRIQRD
jgi:hypothetical protein